MITLQNIRASQDRISSYIHNTPVMTSNSINELGGCKIFFKCENLQRTGSFKLRGALNTVMQLTKLEKSKGVVTSSSGNHGAALSFACRLAKIPVTVIMPKNSSISKIENVRRYGGSIQFCESTQEARDRETSGFINKHGAVLVHPFNDERIMAGQGTVALGFMKEIPSLDVIIVPVSGGGLMSGIISAVKQINENIRIIGAEPEEADDTFRSIQRGSIQINNSTNTICDGLRAQIGSKTFPIIRDHANNIILCKENDIISAMEMIWKIMKIIVEPSSAITLAALLNKRSQLKGKNVGLILSGGNVDLDCLPWHKN